MRMRIIGLLVLVSILAGCANVDGKAENNKPDSGASITFRILSSESESQPAESLRSEIKSVLEARMERRGCTNGLITFPEDRLVRIDLPAKTMEEAEAWGRHLGNLGRLELKGTAAPELLSRARETGEIPKGCELVGPAPESCDPFYKIGERLLVQKDPIIKNGDFQSTEAMPGNIPPAWQICFELKDEASRRFDEAAATLYGYGEEKNKSPGGLLAVIVNGHLECAPRVMTRSFGGKGQVSGNFTEEQAKDFAEVLFSPPLPCPIGSAEKGEGFPEKIELHVAPK